MGNTLAYNQIEDTYNTLSIVNKTPGPLFVAANTYKVRITDYSLGTRWSTMSYTIHPGDSINVEAVANYVAYVNVQGKISNELVFTMADFRVCEGHMHVDITEGGREYVFLGANLEHRSSSRLYYPCVPCDCCACGVYVCCRVMPFPWCLCCMEDPDCWR